MLHISTIFKIVLKKYHKSNLHCYKKLMGIPTPYILKAKNKFLLNDYLENDLIKEVFEKEWDYCIPQKI